MMRESRAMSLDDVANAARQENEDYTLSRSGVYTIEQGDKMPSHKTLVGLAAAYQISLSGLLIELARLLEPTDEQIKTYSPDALIVAGLYERLNRQRREILLSSAQSLLRTQESDTGQP